MRKSNLSLQQTLAARIARKAITAKARQYAADVVRQLPVDTPTEVYNEIADAFVAVAREDNQS